MIRKLPKTYTTEIVHDLKLSLPKTFTTNLFTTKNFHYVTLPFMFNIYGGVVRV